MALTLKSLLESQYGIMQPYDNTSTSYPKQRGTIEEEPFTVDNPENKQRVVAWSWDQLDTLDGDDKDKIRMALLPTELQTLDNVRKIVSRLSNAGYRIADIEESINKYLVGV